MCLEEGVDFAKRFGPKNHALGHNWTSRPTHSTCLRALNSSPMHALSVESLTLVVAPLLAELLHLMCLQGDVFRGLLQDIGENPLTDNALLVEGK